MLPPAHYDLESCLDRVDRLGVFPEAAMRILEVCQNPDTTVRQLEWAVAADPVLSARILQVANSPLYGQQSQVGSLRRAVALLGLEGTRAFAFAMAVSALGSEGGPEARDLYDHAVATAAVVKLLAPHVPGIHGGLMYATALVHDLGLQLMLILEPDATTEMIRKLGHNQSLVMAERVHFGFDHAHLGAASLLRWGLPSPAADVVRDHHDAINGSVFRPRALLQVADHVADGLMAEGTEPESLAERGRWHPLAPLLKMRDHVWDDMAMELPDTLVEMA